MRSIITDNAFQSTHTAKLFFESKDKPFPTFDLLNEIPDSDMAPMTSTFLTFSSFSFASADAKGWRSPAVVYVMHVAW
jgi:hypothetical protein